MALITSSTIEINAKLRIDDEEVRKLEKRLKELGLNIQIDVEEINKKRNAALSQSPLAIAGFSSHEWGITGVGAVIGAIVSALLPVIIDSVKSELERSDAISKIDQSQLDLSNDPIKRAAELNNFLEDKKKFFEMVSPEQFAQSIIDNFNKTGVVLRIENVIAEDPEIAKFFDEEIIQDINDAVEKAVRAEKAVNQASEKLSSEKLANDTLDFLGIGTELLQEQEKQIEIFQKLRSGGFDTGSEFSEGKESILDRTDAIKDEIQEKEKSIKLNKEDNQSLLELGKNQSMVTASTKQLSGNIEGQSESLRVGNQILNLTNEELLNLPGKLAMVDGAFIDTTASQGEYSKSIEDVIKNTNEGAVIFGYTKEQLDGLRDVTDDAAKSAENLGENGLTVASEKAGQAGKSVGALDANLLNLADRNKDVADLQDKVNQTVEDSSVVYDNASESAENYGDTVEQVQNQGGFFEGIKQGFNDFVTNVESNSELMADFFANTLSQMSQSFSDLFFNVLTGKFDDLADLAKQAFEAILRAFLDLVAAIVTKQIVISIGGLFGIGKGAQAAGGGGNPIDIAQQGAGVVGSGLGLFGSGGAFATVEDEKIDYRLVA